ncbi:peptide ABC transporter substrate-binding protein [Enterococcus wangshanyuanii]|uniref:Peptide ABC transporter substrate-binding protein n=1 Tax=Enterococcus wangshanyuanii TaxID=2005703 RepID=A0ABQ1PH34_9ENTE|nr:peptide ABC transporter substrate-binding protein [Enterococcus wangshanyuanii]GGC97190.1 peptide ABC transporter substrate-binding protein [Enterococcus wangshanyuanii]
MKLKKSAFLGLVALSSITLAACGGGSKKADGGTSGEEKVFRLVERQEMPSADPSLATDEVSFVALNNVYEGIYRLDKDSKPQPAGAAEKAEVSEDGLTYKIKLREDAKWTDDKPVKAEDYVYGWQRTVDPATGSEYAYMFNSVKNAEKISKGEMKKEELGIKAVGDYELEITLEQATPFFDYLLAFPSFLPQRQDIVEKYGKDYTTDSDKAVYNGPFTLTDFDGPGTDTNWSYTKNDKYWDKDTVKLDKVTIDVVKEAPTSLNLFQDGQADDVPLSGELAQQMKSDPNFITLKAASTFYLEPNQIEEKSPYRNANLRKALSYAIDRKALVDQILANGSTEPEGLVPVGLAANPKTDEDFAKESGNDIVYDVDKAKESWKKAKEELGISTLSVDLLIDDTDNAKKMAEYLQGSLSETLDGLKVSVSPVPFSVRLDRSNKGDFEIAVSAWGADYADPSSFLDLFVTGNAYNRGHYTNPEYDKLVNSAATTNANNPEARWQDMLDAEKVIMDDMGVIPLYQKAEARLRSEKIKDVVYHSTGAKYDFKWTYIEE